MGLERTLRILADHPHREIVVPVMGQALREERARAFAVRWLLSAPETRAGRELLRGWDALAPGERRLARETARTRLRLAAQQLLRSDRALTRRNVAEYLRGEAARLRPDAPGLLQDLGQLVDDPDPAARTIARGAFLELLLRDAASLTTGRAHDPIVITLSVLLRAWPRHEDARVIEALVACGAPGDEWLQRALSEEWPAAKALRRSLGVPRTPGEARRRIDLLSRWLEGPVAAAREQARKLLRSTECPRLLQAAAERLDPLEESRRAPTWRRLRWWHLDPADLRSLAPQVAGEIVRCIAGGDASPEERAGRLGRLLPHLEGEPLHAALQALRGLPVETLLTELEALLAGPDTAARLLALDLLPPTEIGSLGIVIPQLASPDPEMRERAARRLSGQGWRLWEAGREGVPAEHRASVLGVLRKSMRPSTPCSAVASPRRTALASSPPSRRSSRPASRSDTGKIGSTSSSIGRSGSAPRSPRSSDAPARRRLVRTSRPSSRMETPASWRTRSRGSSGSAEPRASGCSARPRTTPTPGCGRTRSSPSVAAAMRRPSMRWSAGGRWRSPPPGRARAGPGSAFRKGASHEPDRHSRGAPTPRAGAEPTR